MNSPIRLAIVWLCLLAALCNRAVVSLKHHLVLEDDHRVFVSVSSFGYLLGGRLEVIVKNLTIAPPLLLNQVEPEFGFVLIKADMRRNTFIINPEIPRMTCALTDPRRYFNQNLMTMQVKPIQKKVKVRCIGDSKLPAILQMPVQSEKSTSPHGSYKHVPVKRAAGIEQDNTNTTNHMFNGILYPDAKKYDGDYIPETRIDDPSHKCAAPTDDLELQIHESGGRRSYSFNFTMRIDRSEHEGFYHFVFHNCRGRGARVMVESDKVYAFQRTRFNLSMFLWETNYPENYLSAGVMALPQMYFILSVMFSLVGTVWVNFISRQRENALKIHHLMTVLVFAKASSLLFHGINYHYIAVYGQPVVTWAYLYYVTRSLKGALFFMTLALIGSGWSFVKHILSEKDKKIILVIVGLQVIAHVTEIVLDESTEGEKNIELLAEVVSLVDLSCCIAILYPISWSVRHLEEASRTDGKAAINLKKLELFKRFYLISTVYVYVTRILTFVLLSMLSYRYSWLAELIGELATLIYFIITGMYFQPVPTNPYLLLSTDNDQEEDILFSVDAQEMSRLDDKDNANTKEQGVEDPESVLLDGEVVVRKKVTRRLIDDIV